MKYIIILCDYFMHHSLSTTGFIYVAGKGIFLFVTVATLSVGSTQPFTWHNQGVFQGVKATGAHSCLSNCRHCRSL